MSLPSDEEPSLRALTPDEQQPEPALLRQANDQPQPPYGLTAFAVSLLCLIILRGLMPGWDVTLTLLVIPITAATAYFGLLSFRPPVPALAISIVAAMLGLLLSLPATFLYVSVWQSMTNLGLLLAWLALAGVWGALCGRNMHAERNPGAVIAISFLAVFIYVQLWFSYLHPFIQQMHAIPK